MNRAQRFYSIDAKVNEIVRNEKLSDYEKALKIEANIIIPLLDKIEELEKEVSDCRMRDKEYEQLSEYVRKVQERGF